MRRISEKRRHLLETAGPWREAFAAEVGRCEFCGCIGVWPPHEISQGDSRSDSLMLRACILHLCSANENNCHTRLHSMPEYRALGLAILRRSRPQDYNLPMFWHVEGRRHPSQREVDVWIRRLTLGRGGR